jgi:hypothetical protein
VSDVPANVDYLLHLADEVCDERASIEDLAQLDAILSADDVSRRCYLDYCRMHTALGLEIRAQYAVQKLCRQIDSEVSPIAPVAASCAGNSSPPPSIFGITLPGTVGYFSSGWPAAYTIATVICGIAALIGSFIYVSRYEQVVANSPSRAAKHQRATLPKAESVGRIVGMVDCTWAKGSDPRLSKDAVSLGREFKIESGLMEIAYDTGAKVILQGPAAYVVESSNGGFMSLGKLTGKVDTASAKGFAVRTPTATITDLGTEFGVEVDGHGRTVSHVFSGLVRVQVVEGSGVPEGEGQLLHANESARVESRASRQGDTRVIVVDSSVKPADFVRELPKRSVRILDLADVVAGGDGSSGRRNRGIDPTTGRIVAAPPERKILVSDGRYHRVEGLPFVDGVFIPDCRRRTPVQTDSAGHTFEAFDTAFNETWHCVWAGGAIPVGTPARVIPTQLDGVDYSSPGHGLLYMHANKGVTFDLDAIRRANPGYRLVQFRTVVGNTETAAVLAFHGDTSASTVLFSDDFQSATVGAAPGSVKSGSTPAIGSGVVGTWELPDGAGDSVRVRNNASPGNPKSAAGTNKYLAFTRQADDDHSLALATGWPASSTEEQIVQLALSIYVPSGPATDVFGITAFINGSDASGRTISVIQSRSGEVKFHDGIEWKATTLTGKTDVWQNLVITADMAAKKYTISLDGKVYSDAYWEGSAKQIGCLYMSRPTGTVGGNAFIDNLRLQTAARPSTFENSDPALASADAWIIVDGERRSGRRGLNRDSGANPIVIPIAEKDRFLTLAATDGGNGLYWDSILFGDPRLVLIPLGIQQ